MKIFFKIKLLIFLLLSIVIPSAEASVVSKASLDSTVLLMGKTTDLKIKIDQPEGAKGHFPLFDEIYKTGVAKICGDSIELRAPSKIDTIRKSGKESITFNIPLQSFDSGFYKLPKFVYVVGNDTAYSNSLVLKVYPVFAEATDPINPYASVSMPEDLSIFDVVPDWFLDYWWVILLGLLLLAALIYLFVTYKKTGSIIKKKPEPTPYEKAHAAIIALKGANLWQQGMEKEYYSELTDILRNYLYGRFGIRAMEMTSRQIIAAVKRNEQTKPYLKDYRQILAMADFVKFAKVRPLAEDNILAMDNAIKFIEETKPVVVIEPEKGKHNLGNKKISVAKKGGKK